MTARLYWNAVYTRPNCEKKVCRVLEKKHILFYCPQNRVSVTGTKHRRIIIEPLFPSMIFVQVPGWEALSQLTKLPNIASLVYWRQQPASFPVTEINQLRNFLEAHENVSVTKMILHNSTQMPGQIADPLNPPDMSKFQVLQLLSIGYSIQAKAASATSIKMMRKHSEYGIKNDLVLISEFINADKN